MYVTFKGRLGAQEVAAGGANLILESRKLRKGFGFIPDITAFIPTTEEGRLFMQNTMKTLKDLRAGHVVRIVKNLESVSGIQWQRISSTAGTKADRVTNLAQAEALPDQLSFREY